MEEQPAVLQAPAMPAVHLHLRQQPNPPAGTRGHQVSCVSSLLLVLLGVPQPTMSQSRVLRTLGSRYTSSHSLRVALNAVTA